MVNQQLNMQNSSNNIGNQYKNNSLVSIFKCHNKGSIPYKIQNHFQQIDELPIFYDGD